MKNTAFIATSLDGYIADTDGGVGWWETVPNPEGDGVGHLAFSAGNASCSESVQNGKGNYFCTSP